MSEPAEIITTAPTGKRPFYAPDWYKELSNDEYHGSFGFGSTTIKILTEKTYAHMEYERSNPKAPSDPMIIGQAVHTLALEPEKFESEFAVRPEGLRKPSASQLTAKKPADKTLIQIEDWMAWEKSTIGKQELTEEGRVKAEAMAKRLREHPQVGLYLEEGVAEQSVYYWYNPEDFDTENDYRIMCKVRPDWIIPGHSVLFDLKTTRDASYSGFMKQVKALSYHLSGAMYLDGANRCHPFLDFAQVTGFLKFVWICVENFPPYEVASYEMSEDDREEGAMLYHSAIRKLHQYKLSNWKGYGEFNGTTFEPLTRISDIPKYGNKIV